MRAIRGNRIAMIFQEPMNSLNPALTVGLQVAEPVQQHRGVSWTAALDAAKALLQKVQHPRRRRAGCTPIRTSTRAACASAR